MTKDKLKTIIEQFVDLLMPELTAYESTLYLFLLRSSFIENGTLEVRIGKRTIAEKYGIGQGENRISYNQVSKVIKKLEEKGCIEVDDSSFKGGTSYRVILPENIPLVAEKLTKRNF